jgi:hypothetical protein
MKTTLLTVICVLAIGSASVTPCYADSDKAAKIIADVAVLRPAGLLATAIGSVFFVASLPFSAATGTIKETAHTLVIAPAKNTFKRPLGNMDTVQDITWSDK